MDSYAFRDHIVQRGYQRLGSGAHATVFGKPDSSKVVKIGWEIDNWLQYATWAISKGYVGKQAPRIDSFKVYADSRFYVAIMERLNPLNDNGFRMRKEVAYEYSDSFRCGELPENWVGFVRDFTAEFSIGSSCYDLGTKNWMQRDNGELVLTDPLCETCWVGSLRTKRYRSSSSKN